MTVEQTRHAWRIAGISIAASLVLILVLYHQTVLYLTGLWNELEVGDYAHGYLVLTISLYLIERNRRELASLTPRPSYWALPAVAADLSDSPESTRKLLREFVIETESSISRMVEEKS